MIKKVEITTNTQPQTELEKAILSVSNGIATKLNEIIDAVNNIQKEREAERFEIQEWIGILESVRKSVNKHEDIIRQIGEWGNSKGECLWCENLTEVNLDVKSRSENVQDKFEEQRKWIGMLCRFWDDNFKIIKHFGILTRIDETAIVPYEAENGFWYCACEPVKPDDNIIYRGE